MNLLFHAPHLLWLGALVAPLVALWFLRLKRPPRQVASLALWRHAVEDQRANALFQRLRRHLPLLLQILALLAIALAAAQPVWSGAGAAARREAIVVDISASMASRIQGRSRLDEARTLARGRFAAVGGDHEACLVALGAQATLVVPFTSDRRRLERALDGLTVGCTAGDPAEALRLLRALHRSEPFAAAVLITDAVLPAEADEDLACPLELQRVAPGGANLGITALQARLGADSAWEVQAEVTASAEAGRGGVLRLLAGSVELASKAVAPAPLSASRVVVRVPGGAAVVIQARIEAAGDDALDLDDQAWLALPAVEPLRTWVAPRLTRWKRAVAAHPAVRLVEDPQGVDLLIGDSVADLAHAARVRLGVGVVPAELAGRIAVAPDDRGSRLVDARAAHPLLAHLRLDDLAIAERVSWLGSSGEREVEAAGWTVLAHGDAGPLLLERLRGDGVDWNLLFHSDRSDLPYRLAFPVLCGNLVQAALHAAGRSEAAAQPTGLLPALHVGPGAATVDGPAGSSSALADSDGLLSGIAAPLPGLYHLRGTRAELQVGTGLLDQRESRLQPIDGLRAREVAVAEAQSRPGDLALWPWLAAAALALLLGEWWLVNRSPLSGKQDRAASGEPGATLHVDRR